MALSTSMNDTASGSAAFSADGASSSRQPARQFQSALLQKIDALLNEGRPEDALRAIPSNLLTDPAYKNAQCVCFLRLGQIEAAVQGLRMICVTPHLSLRPEVPLEFKVNFATALLLNGTVEGCLATLKEIGQDEHPSVQRLRQAIRAAKGSWPLGRRLLWQLGFGSAPRVHLDYPAGELNPG